MVPDKYWIIVIANSSSSDKVCQGMRLLSYGSVQMLSLIYEGSGRLCQKWKK